MLFKSSVKAGHEYLTKKQVKKSYSLKLNKYLDRNSIYQHLRTKLNRSSIEAESVEIYEIRISKSDFWPLLTCMCRVSFLTTQDIYKAYFKGCHTRRIYAESDLVHYSLWRSYCIFMPRVLWPRSFLIFIVDEVKNFVANNLLQVGELVTYWDPCIIG